MTALHDLWDLAPDEALAVLALHDSITPGCRCPACRQARRTLTGEQLALWSEECPEG